MRASDARPDFVCELPCFVAAIKKIFRPSEIRVYLENLKRVGAQGHVLTERQYEFMKDNRAFDDDVVRGAEDVLIVGRIREMLLE